MGRHWINVGKYTIITWIVWELVLKKCLLESLHTKKIEADIQQFHLPRHNSAKTIMV